MYNVAQYKTYTFTLEQENKRSILNRSTERYDKQMLFVGLIAFICCFLFVYIFLFSIPKSYHSKPFFLFIYLLWFCFFFIMTNFCPVCSLLLKPKYVTCWDNMTSTNFICGNFMFQSNFKLSFNARAHIQRKSELK